MALYQTFLSVSSIVSTEVIALLIRWPDGICHGKYVAGSHIADVVCLTVVQ